MLRSMRHLKELRNRSKVETVQEKRDWSCNLVTERARGPLVITECSLVRFSPMISKYLSSSNLDMAKSADIGVPETTILFVDDNNTLGLLLSVA